MCQALGRCDKELKAVHTAITGGTLVKQARTAGAGSRKHEILFQCCSHRLQMALMRLKDRPQYI